MSRTLRVPLSTDQIDGLAAVLEYVRTGDVRTRPALALSTGLGRTVIAQRTAQLVELGLIEDGDLGPSTGGRAARQLRFQAAAGCILVGVFGASSVAVGLLDLCGRLIAHHEDDCNIALGPEQCLHRLDRFFTTLLADQHVDAMSVWGIGIGLAGPVEFASGRPVAPPIMPGWDGYPVRDWLAARYRVPVWVDNEVNAMALGEMRAGRAVTESEFVYVKIGTGIGSGLVSGGRYTGGRRAVRVISAMSPRSTVHG